MTESKPNFIFVLSTTGSLMGKVLATETVRRAVHSVVAVSEGPGLDKARAAGLPATALPSGSNEEFCRHLLNYMDRHKIDYILSFYTDFYTDECRHALRDRIINFHPSLLPAFKGMDGFGDGIAYHTKIIGTTVELIKDVMDEGKIVMQAALTVNPNDTLAATRHRIFVQQCRTLVQVVDWIVQGRLSVDGDKVTIANALYTTPDFAPALENAEAIAFDPDQVVLEKTA